jgi:hypothetical protein
MRAFAFRFAGFGIALRLLIAAASLVATEARAQSTGGYLPPNVRRPPAGAVPPPAAVPPAPYPSTATPGASGAAAAQIRLIEPENSPRVSGTADGNEPGSNPDAAQSDLRLQSRSPAGTGPQDPTMPGPNMRELLGSGDANRNVPAGPPPLPELRIRARIFPRNKPPVAVIDVAGRQLSVRVGSEIQLSTAGGAMQLKVVELTMSELQIEVVGRKQIITLN